MPISHSSLQVVALSLALVSSLHAQSVGSRPPVRDIAFARDGRLAASIDGDLWVRAANGSTWNQLTSGATWDRQPAWTPDGAAVVFSSDRSGNDDLWRVAVDGNGQAGEATRLTTDPAPDLEPTLLKDGTIIFVRGRLNSARLWQRGPSGGEKRVTSGSAAERSPQASPDGERYAYIQQNDDGRRVRIRRLGATTDSVVTADRPADDVTWSPDGSRIALSAATPRPGVYVTPLNGRYVNFVGGRRGDLAWSPDGATILIAERGADEPGYNGDPDRVGDRGTETVLSSLDRLLSVRAPLPPDDDSLVVAVNAPIDQRARNREAFDRFVGRTHDTYFSGPRAGDKAAAWRQLATRYRSRAESAPDDHALENVMHAMLRERPSLRDGATGRAAVSSAHPVATEAGLEMLRRGGNVVDAAVAVSFALGVVEPDASGIGGYGEMLVYTRGMAQPALIEFMARVPEEASLANASLTTGGRYPSDGPVLAMVPGTVAAMHTAWKRHGSGKVPWADLLAPAIRAASDGYVVSDGLATTLQREREGFTRYEGSRALFFREGKPRIAGDTIRNPDLSWTLQQIAKDGANGFYRGEVARRLVSDLRGKGNAMRLTDLSRYFAADREPVVSTYRGLTVFGSAPPVSGGAILAAQLNNLEQFRGMKPYTEDAATLHAMIAAWQLVPSSRNRIADPSLWPTDLTAFTSKDTAHSRWKCFDATRALTPAMFRGDTLTCAAGAAPPATTAPAPADTTGEETLAHLPAEDTCTSENHAQGAPCRAQGTTSFVVADAAGNVVAVTQTLGTWGGNFYVTPGLGFLYNDKLTSYGTDPGGYGARLPYARHGSTLSPAIVFRGEGANRRPVLTVGAAGNAWITSAVYQSLIGVLDFGLTPQRALELPRFLPSQRSGPGPGPAAREYQIDIEDGIAPDVLRRLQGMGYRFNRISLKGELRMGYGAAIAIGDNSVTAGADPRRSGAAGATEK